MTITRLASAGRKHVARIAANAVSVSVPLAGPAMATAC